MKSKKLIAMILSAVMCLGILAGCGAQTADDPAGKGTKPDGGKIQQDAGSDTVKAESIDVLEPGDGGEPDPLSTDIKALFDSDTELVLDVAAEDLAEEAVALAGGPVAMYGVVPVASGTLVAQAKDCEIDYSNMADGYFMAKWTGDNIKIKVQATGPSGVTYTYDYKPSGWNTFPFSDGSGSYLIRIMRNTTGTKYAVALKTTVDVSLKDPFAPFLASNQYVDFANATKTQAKASDLCSGKSGELDKVAAVYDWVVDNVAYDYNKARTVQSGYVPVLDDTVSSGYGICFDYASLMTGMLRCQGVPCKLVIGYAGKAYHAWISVYVEGQGWVDGVIFFDGTTWQRMDPTYASTGARSDSIMEYIGDGSHYTSKYMY